MRTSSVLARSASSSLSYNLLANLFLYLGQVVIARELERPNYAMYATVISFLSLMATLADLGWASPLVRAFAQAESLALQGKQDERGELLGSVLWSKLFLAVTVAGISIVLSLFLYGPGMAELVAIGAITFLISSRMLVVRIVLESFLRAEGRLSTVLKLAAVDALGFAVLLVILAQYRIGLVDVVWVYSLCHAPGFLLLLWFFRRTLLSQKIHLRFDLKRLVRFSKAEIPVTIGVWMMAVHNMADTLLLNSLSNSMEVSAFSAAFRLISGLLFIPVVIASATAPEVTKRLAHGDDSTAARVAAQGLHFSLLLSLLLALIVTASAPALVNVLLGTHYQDAIQLVLIFGWMFIPITIGAYTLEMTVATGTGRLYILYCAVLAIVTVVGNLLFASSLGAVGSVFIKLLGITLGCVLLARYFRHHAVGRALFERDWIRFASLAVVCLVVLYGLYLLELSLVPRLAVLLVVFVGTALWMQLLQPRTMKVLLDSVTHRATI